MKQISLLIFILSAIIVSTPGYALDPTFTTLFSDKAIRGYDTVAYFTEGKPVEGDEQYAIEYNEATWLFSSAENLELFKADPEKYAPQYGGYCAWAVSQNKTASTQPDLFTIVDGKLYLNYSEGINEKWLADKEQFIIDGDKNWPGLLAE